MTTQPGVMVIATAALLAAALGPERATAQSMDAALVAPEGTARASLATARSVEPPAASIVVDLGAFDGWLEELTEALRDRPSTVGLHRAVPVEKAGDLAPSLVWTDESPVSAAFGVCSRGAKSVRARVAATLPEAALVTVFDAQGKNPRGGWTGDDVAEDGADGAWLPAQ